MCVCVCRVCCTTTHTTHILAVHASLASVVVNTDHKLGIGSTIAEAKNIMTFSSEIHYFIFRSKS